MNKQAVFRSVLEDIEFGPQLVPPIPFGGPDVKHICTHFKLYGDFKYGPWASKAIKNLAASLNRFPGPISMWRIGAPPESFNAHEYSIYNDGDICFREMRRNLPETWTEPAEDIDPADFEPTLRHPDCIEVRFDMVFRFTHE